MSLPFLWAIFADLWCIFSFLAEIPGPPMPKYSICGVNIWTWPEQGMGTISGCLFLFLQTIFADSGHIFPFFAEIPGPPIPKYSVCGGYCGGDSWNWPGQGTGSVPGCILLSLDTSLADFGAI